MREIKFRGKKEDNSEWVFGFIEIHLVDGDLTQNKQTAFITCDTMNKIGKVYRDTFKVIPETAGQYTGLKDKNGKEIYEGDIVTLTIYQANSKRVLAYNPKNVAIVWNEKCAKFGWWQNVEYEESEQWFADFNTYVNLGMEVIGNIYENKDLINNS